MIEINNLTYRWPGTDKPQLDIEHLSVRQGEKLFISGESGSGKSTLLGLLAGISVPDTGTITIADTELSSLSASKRDIFRADHVGMIFQQFNLLPYLNVLENVLLPCHFSSVRRQRLTTEANRAATLLLSDLGLSPTLFTKPVTALSIGQQQRVAVARALMGKPELVIADEPTSALDQNARDKFLSLLVSQCEATGSSLLFVSHDQTLKSHFDREVCLSEINRAKSVSDDEDTHETGVLDAGVSESKERTRS
ncbi:ABC transporter ATP-binding protein [Veronia pacifica]|uniref:Methionine ABC transporter ATP-binding protein n=1 Tax=Veronia pacifica TaxID=1080227 RepID=A0A1C3EID0_9GAMM|nr:ABC transporter ATP-binding protein [Veronia pacifica]ODA32994.1 methionine ABC transporter ATP-binding protein [Veronia pacifica]